MVAQVGKYAVVDADGVVRNVIVAEPEFDPGDGLRLVLAEGEPVGPGHRWDGRQFHAPEPSQEIPGGGVDMAQLSAGTTVGGKPITKVAAGAYVGDGSLNRLITVGFNPAVVIVTSGNNIRAWGISDGAGGVHGLAANGTAVTITNTDGVAPRPTTGGFTVSQGGTIGLNVSGVTYRYVAIG